MLCKRSVPATTSVPHRNVHSLRVSLPILGARTKTNTIEFASRNFIASELARYNKRAQVHLNLAKQRTHSELKLCTCNVALTSGTASGGLGDAACDPTQHQTHNLPIAVPAQATRVLQCHCQPSGRQTRHPLTCRAALRQSRCRALCPTSAGQQGLVQGLRARVCPRCSLLWHCPESPGTQRHPIAIHVGDATLEHS